MSERRSAPVLAAAAAAIAIAACGDGERIVLGRGAAASPALAGPFGPPEIVSEIAATGSNDFKETLTADMLEIYFCSDRPGGPGNQDVWRATRPSTSAPWGAPTCVLEVSSPSTETGPAVSADGLTLWVGSDRPGGKGGLDIWVSTRPDRSSPWSAPVPVGVLNTAGDEFPRPPGEAGLVMPAAYRSASNHQYQTFTSDRASLGAAWGAPVRLAEVDTSGIDTDAFLTDDGLTLAFSSDRLSAGDQDLFWALRSDLQSPFGSFAPIAELNVAGAADRDPWLSPDGREMYFSSDRSGTLQIYRAAR